MRLNDLGTERVAPSYALASVFSRMKGFLTCSTRWSCRESRIHVFCVIRTGKRYGLWELPMHQNHSWPPESSTTRLTTDNIAARRPHVAPGYHSFALRSIYCFIPTATVRRKSARQQGDSMQKENNPMRKQEKIQEAKGIDLPSSTPTRPSARPESK